MDKLILENVRCFKGRHEIPLAPLTLLIGENSTGKSTLLSAIRLAWDIRLGNPFPDFNEVPFDWGAFEQVSHLEGKNGDKQKQFNIGFEERIVAPSGSQCNFDIEAIFRPHGSQPVIDEWRILYDSIQIQACIIDQNKFNIRLEKNGQRDETIYNEGSIGTGFLALATIATFLRKSKILTKEESTSFGDMIHQNWLRRLNNRPNAVAPIRTKPKRTYDRLRETPSPEGDHIPMVLARIRSSEPESWETLTEELTFFGKSSGLFSGVEIKLLGSESDPFQVQILIENVKVNLIDVGYGISQILPIIVDSVLAEEGQTLLMQQPEVHLHPKAQAALGSFFGALVSYKKQMIIETHSDYLIDRIRADVRDGKNNLEPKDVILLYFERKGAAVQIHPIELDSAGNLINVPSGYRQFFLEETERILGG